MRGRQRRNPIVANTRIAGEITDAREYIERRWFSRMERDSGMAALVTARDARREPFHRWLAFRQAFSPELVRRFLSHLDDAGIVDQETPLLDPFSGTGTFVTECARQGRLAIGVDALMAAAFVTSTKPATAMPEVPDLAGCATWQEIADRLADSLHRAALICAVAAHTTAKGTLNKNAPPMIEAFREMIEVMRVDLRTPLKRANLALTGDGRKLGFLADSSIGGILTSPPYLSRHDYSKLTLPYEDVCAHWYGHPRSNQMPASPRGRTSKRRGDVPAAVTESCDTLDLVGQHKLARVVRAYFLDTIGFLKQCARVLQPGRPLWLVIGGARLKDVYVPTDSILAEHAESIGLTVRQFVVARDLIPGPRKFGRLPNITPRESILVMTRS